MGVIGIVALFYAYRALIHAMNILGLSGFEWTKAPLKWHILDVVYLVLDELVAIGLLLKWKISYFAFYIAAKSQIVLYTQFKEWNIEVPNEFAASPEQTSYLDSLVICHIITLTLVTAALTTISRIKP